MAALKFTLRALLLVLLLALAAAVGGAVWWLTQPLGMPAEGVELSIEPGTTPREVARAWVQAGVQTPEWALYAWFRLSGESRRIRAGSYAALPGDTPQHLLSKLVQGDDKLLRVRLIEGWTLRQWRAALAKAPGLKPTGAAMGEAELMAALGLAGQPGEGRFFPDTYLYSNGVSDLAVMRRAAQAMDQHLAAVWRQRPADSVLASTADALVLASIVEKETGRASDRGRIAGVFSNRLRIGMPLQTDPSVIYGLGDSFDGNLRKRDLQSDTPFNTYTRKGLPPTPIAMPGLAALRAAVQPEATRALYFVARGDGSSVFSETLDAHNRAVNQYQRKSSAVAASASESVSAAAMAPASAALTAPAPAAAGPGAAARAEALAAQPARQRP